MNSPPADGDISASTNVTFLSQLELCIEKENHLTKNYNTAQ